MSTDRSALFNLSATAVAEAGTKAAQFAAVALIARMLGPEGFGVVGAAWALFQLALPIVQGAPEMLGVRNLSADRSAGPDRIVDVTAMKLVLAIGTAGVLTGYAAIVYGPGMPGTTQTVAQAAVLLGVATMPSWAARSFQRNDLYAGPRLIQACLFAVLAAGALVLWPSPLVVPLADGAAWAIATIFGFRMLRPLLPSLSLGRVLRGLTDRVRLRAALAGDGRDTFRLASAGIASAAIWWVPVLTAELFYGAAAGGHVAAAVRLVLIPLVVLQLGLQVFLPILAKYHANDRDRFRSLVAALTFYSAFAHLAVAVPMALLAGPLTSFVFGSDFEAAVPLVAIFSAALVPLGMGSAYGYALIAANRSGMFFMLSTAGALAVLGGQTAGMILSGTPEGLVWGVPCLAFKLLAFAIYAHAAGLVGDGTFAFRRLAPRHIVRFLAER